MDNAPKRHGHPLVLATELAAFAAVFALTAFAAQAPVAAAPVPTGTGASVWYLLSLVAASTGIVLLLLRTVRGSRVFSAFFALAVLVGVSALAERLISPGGAVIAASAAVLAYYGLRRVFVLDLILVLGMAGIAAHVGSGLAPHAVVILLAVMAAYDVLAVYGTKHMVFMAQRLLRDKVFFAIILPWSARGFLARLDSIEPGKGFFFLGSGDVTLPALLVASTAAQTSLAAALAVSAGACIGLVATHLIFMAQKAPKPMPALPPIMLGAVAGYVFSLAFT